MSTFTVLPLRPGASRRQVAWQGGIILMEVLMAAAILAAAALALIAIRDRCIAREHASAQLLAAAYAADRLIGEVVLDPARMANMDEGEVEGLPGATYRREVVLQSEAASARLLQIHVTVSYLVGGQRRAFDLERWVYQSHARSPRR